MYYSTTNRPQPHRHIYLGANENLAQRPDCASEREFSAHVGFSGQGSVGVLRRHGEQKTQREDSLCSDSTPVWVEYKYSGVDGCDNTTRITLQEIPPPSYLVECFNPSQRLEFLSELAIRQKFQRKLDREDVSSRATPRVAKSLTTRGTRIIRDGAALLEYKYGCRKLGFYTLTCPYTDSSEIQKFNDCYPEILRRYFQELKREYKRQGLSFSYLGVYEVQPGRFERTGDECLHFHYISPALHPCGKFVVRHEWIRAVYSRIVKAVCGADFRSLPRVDAQLVKKSGAAYLAKYFSKGKLADASTIPDGARAELSSWYSVSRNLLTAIRQSRVELPGHIADDLFRCSRAETIPSYARYVRPIYVEFDGNEFHVGCVFQLDGIFMDSLREITFPQVSSLI